MIIEEKIGKYLKEGNREIKSADCCGNCGYFEKPYDSAKCTYWDEMVGKTQVCKHFER